MNRRDLLKGAATVAVVGTSISEAEAGGREQPLDDLQLEAELRQLRIDLERIEHTDDLGLASRIGGQQPTSQNPAYERLVRSTMRTLAIAETVSSLPQSNRADDRVVALVGEHAAEMEYASRSQNLLLGSMSRADRREVRRQLRESPKRAYDLADHIDGIAAHSAVPSRRRRRLKKMVKTVTWKMQHESIDTLVEELPEGPERVGALADVAGEPIAARLQPYVTQASVDRWNHEKRALHRVLDIRTITDEDVQGGTPDSAAPAAAPAASTSSERTPGERRLRLATTELTIAAICGGVALSLIAMAALAGDGALVIIAIVGGAMAITGFVVLLIIGLITLAVAANMISKERNR